MPLDNLNGDVIEQVMSLENLTPVIRPEKILNGDAIAPVTRKEYFMQKGASGGGGGGGGGVFPVEMFYDVATESLHSNKTSTEIISAYNSGLLPYLYFDEEGQITICPVKSFDTDQVTFELLDVTINNNNITTLNAERYLVGDTGVIVSFSGYVHF